MARDDLLEQGQSQAEPAVSGGCAAVEPVEDPSGIRLVETLAGVGDHEFGAGVDGPGGHGDAASCGGVGQCNAGRLRVLVAQALGESSAPQAIQSIDRVLVGPSGKPDKRALPAVDRS
nr:hypothetical protein [Micromonospora yangpuensis]